MRKIDLFTIMSANQLQRIFQHRHHSKTKQIDLHNSHVRAIVFVPLHDGAAGHCRRFTRNHLIQLSLANHHTAGMLSEMSWQILKTQTQLEKFADPWLAHIETGDTELRFKSVRFILVFEMSDKPCQALQCFHIKAEDL